jgi:hypothetical protein
VGVPGGPYALRTAQLPQERSSRRGGRAVTACATPATPAPRRRPPPVPGRRRDGSRCSRVWNIDRGRAEPHPEEDKSRFSRVWKISLKLRRGGRRGGPDPRRGAAGEQGGERAWTRRCRPMQGGCACLQDLQDATTAYLPSGASPTHPGIPPQETRNHLHTEEVNGTILGPFFRQPLPEGAFPRLILPNRQWA